MRIKNGKRIIAMVMAALMVVGLIPFSMLSGLFQKEVKADGKTETKTYSFDYSTLTATADKEALAAGTKFDDNIEVFGTVQKRISSETKAVTSVETAKLSGGGFKFTVEGTATVDIKFSSNGGSNTSDLAVLDSTGAKVADKNGNTSNEVKGSADAAITVTYTLTAGEYKITSPGLTDTTKGRGARIYTIDISDEVPLPTVKNTYTFDYSTLTATADKEALAAGTKFDDNIEVFGTVQKRISSETKAVTSVETTKLSGGGFKFTVEGDATLAIKFSSNGGSNTSDLAVLDSTGAKVADNNGNTSNEVKGSADAAITVNYTLTAGEYKITSPGLTDTTKGRGARIYTIELIDEVVSSASNPPEGLAITATQDETDKTVVNIEVTSTKPGSTGSSYVVTRALEGEEPEIIKTITEGNKASATLTNIPPKSGLYTYAVYGVGKDKNGEEVKSESSASTTVDFGFSWNDVADPVLSEIVLDKSNLKVKLTAEFGTYGGEYALVTLYQDGFEVSTQKVQASGDVIFAPKADGSFEAKAVLCREGLPDKASNVVSVDNFVKPMDDPTISWVNNLGNGSVYVDWNNVSCDSFTVLYKAAGDNDYTEAVSGLTEGNYTIEGLTAGTTYEIKVVASKTDFDDTESISEITVGDAKQEWYLGAIGSATKGNVAINGGDASNVETGTPKKVDDLTNDSDAKITFNSVDNGKIADSEDGFIYYYTKINPNTENFKMSATFTVTSTASDTQSAFGLYAVDIVGFGTKDAKYFNSVSVINGKASKTALGDFYHANVSRIVTGYSNYNTEDSTGVTRVLDSTHIFDKQEEVDAAAEGSVYTYTLEKTDEGFVASMDGAEESITWDGSTSVMVQEDGSMAIGIAVARKVGVDVTDITFEKSAGSAAAASGETIIDPKFNVFSSKNTGSSDYEFIGSANVDGTLVITANGTEYDPIAVTADKIVKLPIELWAEGKFNNISYTFTPSEDVANLSSYEAAGATLKVGYGVIGKSGEAMYVSPDGKSSGKGTKASPLDLQTALNYAQAGQTIVMLDGTYKPTADYVVGRSQNGTADAPIVLVAETVGEVVIDGSDLEKSSGMLTIVGSYWHVFGIDFINSPGKGVSVSGNYNTVEMCNMIANGNSGLQISRYAGEPNDADMWPTGNLIKNCTAYDNCDPGRNDADGFAAKLTCGEGNVFYGCISHNNIDDGWDLYAKSTTGSIGVVTIENCVTYSNGWLTYEDPAEVGYGEGNGFKLGGENMYGAHKLINSISFNNAGKGITSNSGPDCQVIRCTSYNNSLKGKSYNLSLYTKTSNLKAWVVEGMLSVCTNDTTASELGASNGVIYGLRSETNYLYDGANSYNSLGVKATEDWFENVDVTVLPTRNEDGTIDMHGLLKIVEDPAYTETVESVSNDAAASYLSELTYCPAGVGARLDTTSAKAISVKPAIPSATVSNINIPTGDKATSSTMMMYVIMMLVAAAAITGVVIFEKKRRA